jgi:hypothetical protein
MATATVWKNVAVAMQSALAAAKTITAITKASPGVASSTAHGYSNGDFVFLTVSGMYQLNDKVVRVSSVTTDTFALEGVDTTLFETFSSGTAEKITFGTSITTATTITSSGGNFEFIDSTTIHGNSKSQLPGLPEATTFSMDHIWDVSDTGLLALKSASDNRSKRAFKFTFGSGGKIMAFAGYVGAALLPGGSAQQLVTTPSVITMGGSPTYYAS